MQLIHNDKLAFIEMRRVALLREHHRETFRRRDQEMRRTLSKPDSLGRGCVARPQMKP